MAVNDQEVEYKCQLSGCSHAKYLNTGSKINFLVCLPVAVKVTNSSGKNIFQPAIKLQLRKRDDLLLFFLIVLIILIYSEYL